VTQEVVKEHTVEIIQEEITRDIHIHHHYTYIQPVRAVEVLPARHFVIDPVTGVKTEIPAPPGWEMPTDVRPRTIDAGSLVSATRHYLVDEQYPHGKLESTSQQVQKKPSRELKAMANASHKAMWSPFPRTTSKGNHPDRDTGLNGFNHTSAA
jgi:hypothetical protein